MFLIKLFYISCLIFTSLSVLYLIYDSKYPKIKRLNDNILKEEVLIYNFEFLSQKHIDDLQNIILNNYNFFDINISSIFLITFIFTTKTTKKDIFDLKDLFNFDTKFNDNIVFEMLVLLKSFNVILTKDIFTTFLQKFFYYLMIEDDKKFELLEKIKDKKNTFDRIQKRTISYDFNKNVFEKKFKDGMPIFNFFYVLILRFAYDISVKNLNNYKIKF